MKFSYFVGEGHLMWAVGKRDIKRMHFIKLCSVITNTILCDFILICYSRIHNSVIPRSEVVEVFVSQLSPIIDWVLLGKGCYKLPSRWISGKGDFQATFLSAQVRNGPKLLPSSTILAVTISILDFKSLT